MPTIFSHALMPAAVAIGLGRGRIPRPLLLAGVVAAMLPDADVIGFRLGIAYADALGHRGASHSIAFALVLGLLALAPHHRLGAGPWRAGAFVALSALSHPLLDMFTNGGHGVALFWPIADARLFAPWPVIEVSPFARGFFSARGLQVLWSETRWIAAPALMLVVALRWATPGPAKSAPDQR